jgi:exopolysaccharide biosynthesis polyprenyl glycosylphosphotransferase
MAILPKLTPRHKLLLMALDAMAFLALIPILYTFRVGEFHFSYFFSTGLLLILLCLLTCSYVLGNYDIDDLKGRQLGMRMLISVAITLSVVILANYFMAKERMGIFGRGVLVGSLLSYAVVASSYRLFFRKYFKRVANQSKWLILCDPKIDELIRRDQLQTLLRGHYQLVDVTKVSSAEELGGRLEDYSGFVVAANVSSLNQNWKLFLLDQKMKGESVIGWADFIESVLRKIPVEHIQIDWLFFNTGYKILGHSWLIRLKRLHDLIFSIVLIFFTWPLMIFTAIGVRLDSEGPVFYQQVRSGLKGRLFTIYKFRSMRTDAEQDGPQWASTGDTRVTGFGNFIRKTRLDELPQLWNVLKGDMSFIGPRPERPEFNEELEKQIPYYSLRLYVRPGLTGWAQILYPYGASVIDSKNKLEYDLYYIKNYSFLLDYLILLRTVKIVLFGQGR